MIHKGKKGKNFSLFNFFDDLVEWNGGYSSKVCMFFSFIKILILLLNS